MAQREDSHQYTEFNKHHKQRQEGMSYWRLCEDCHQYAQYDRPCPRCQRMLTSTILVRCKCGVFRQGKHCHNCERYRNNGADI